MADNPLPRQFDVILSHNSKDKPAVIALVTANRRLFPSHCPTVRNNSQAKLYSQSASSEPATVTLGVGLWAVVVGIEHFELAS